MSTPRCTRNTKRSESTGVSAGPVARERLDSKVTVLAIEQALAELGIHAKLSDIVAKAHSMESAITQSRSRHKLEHLC